MLSATPNTRHSGHIRTDQTTAMTAKLPPNLLALFAPRPPVRYLPPTAKALDDVKPSHISGVAQYLDDLKNYDKEVPYEPTECWLQRKARLKEEKREKLRQLLEEGAVQCALSSAVCCLF